MTDLDLATSTSLAGSADETALQVRALADKDAIRALGALYSIAVDDHDLATVVRCFATDGAFTRAGTTYAGHDVLRSFYGAMMDRYVTTLHIPTATSSRSTPLPAPPPACSPARRSSPSARVC